MKTRLPFPQMAPEMWYGNPVNGGRVPRWPRMLANIGKVVANLHRIIAKINGRLTHENLAANVQLTSADFLENQSLFCMTVAIIINNTNFDFYVPVNGTLIAWAVHEVRNYNSGQDTVGRQATQGPVYSFTGTLSKVTGGVPTLLSTIKVFPAGLVAPTQIGGLDSNGPVPSDRSVTGAYGLGQNPSFTSGVDSLRININSVTAIGSHDAFYCYVWFKAPWRAI